jgi:hypothetical protein
VRLLTLFTLISALCSQAAFGWGYVGHRAVGEIAQRHLTPKARQAVSRILNGESLAHASTWADEVRSDAAYKHQDPWHYVDYPIGTSYDPTKASPKGDVIGSLIRIRLELLDPASSHAKKATNIRLMSHFIGDMHQPLHVGNGTDQGGNLCSVTYMDENTNLHALWDEKLIDSMRLSYTELVNFIDTATKAEFTAATAGNFEEWAAESASVREKIYPISVGSTAKSEAPSERTYCRKNTQDPLPDAKLIPKLSFAYRYEHWPLIEKRIRLAGYRLAGQLNEIFAK